MSSTQWGCNTSTSSSSRNSKVTEKRRIEHNNLQIFEYTKTYFKEIYSHYENERKDTLYILDTEKITKDNKPYYVIFDCLIYESKNINAYKYMDRLKYVHSFVDGFNEIINVIAIECFTIKTKTAEEIYKKWKNLIHTVKTKRISGLDNLEGVKTDGLILHKNDSNFIDGKIYKLKNVFMMTTDFKLMWIPEKKVYYLYLIGNTADLLRSQPMNNQYSKQHFGYSPMEQNKGIYLLFDTPFIQQSYEFEPDLKWFEPTECINEYMDEDMKEDINNLMSKMCKNPMNYNNAIVEMTLYGSTQKWLPMRVRHDKENSNSYKVGLSNVECIYNMLSASYCKQKKVNRNLEYFYKYTLEKYFNDKLEHKRFLWHTNEHEQINNILHLVPINEIYIVSNDKLTLTNTCQTIYNNTADIVPIYNKSIVHNSASIVDINCIHYDVKRGDDTIDIYNELLKTTFVDNSINIYFETRFHQITTTMEAYINLLSKVVSIGGYYVVLSEKRIQRENKNKLTKLFTITVDNERIIRESDGKIMFLSVFIK